MSAVSYDGLARRIAVDRDAIKQAILDVGRSDEFILKGRVAAFEDRLAARLGLAHVACVSSGTDAVRLALAALGAGPGDEVVVPAFGFHSTVSAVLHAGATPVLADVTPETWLLDPEAAAAAVTPRTAGLVGVHMFSAMADMPALRALADRRDAWLLENAAIALGMAWDGRPAGGWGDLGVFSFHPYKPLAGATDGGAVVTDDDALGTRCRMLRNHGQPLGVRFTHELVGFNARMDEANAQVLARRLERFDDDLARRARIAARYDEAFAPLAPRLRTPPPVPHDRTWYAYVVMSEARDALRDALAQRGIETRVYYPLPIHLQPAFASLGHARGAFPNAERACAECLSLPLYPEMPDNEVAAVIDAVRDHHG